MNEVRFKLIIRTLDGTFDQLSSRPGSIRPLEETIRGDLAANDAGMVSELLPDVTPKGANNQFVKEIARGGMGNVHQFWQAYDARIKAPK